MVIQHTMGTQGIVSDSVQTTWTFFDLCQTLEVGICSTLMLVSGECSRAPEGGRIINIYQSQKHFGRNGGKRIKFWEEKTKNKKPRWRKKVEKTKLEGTVLFAPAWDLAKCIQEMAFLKPQTFKTLDSYNFSS